MAETIKEFLVSLGYQVDGASESKFKNSVATATKGAVALGVSLTAAATAVGAAVTKIAAGFDEMFFMSQRAGASVQNIKGLSYAVSQLGGSYQGALASIESFAQKLRSNPGYESLVKSLGVATRENGRLRETTAIVQDLAKALSKKPQYVALQYLEALGIDERTYNAIRSGDLTRFMEEYASKARALGVDQKQAADIGNQLTQAWRSLGATAELIGAKLEQTLGKSLASFVKDIDDFLLRNADKIVTFFDELGKAAVWLAGAFTKLVEALTPAWQAFDKVAQSLTGQSGLQVALEAFAVWLVGSWLLRILGAFTAVGAGWGAMLLKLGINPITLGAAGALALSTSPANGGEDAEIARRRANGTWGKTPNDGTPGAAPEIKDERNWWQRTMPSWLGGKDAPGPTAWTGGPGGARGMAGAQEAYAFWRSKGLSHEQATGVVANEQAESNHNPRARGDGGAAHGLYQHHPDRRANILAGTGIDMSTAGANQQRQGAYWEMTIGKERATWKALQNAKTAAEAAAIVTQKYERPADPAEAYKRAANAERLARVLSLPEAASAAPSNILDMLRKSPNVPILDRVSGNAALVGGGTSEPTGSPLLPAAANNNTSVDMQQKTEITILGGSDPSATASAVSDAQNGVNGRMLRNMTGAVR